MMGGTKTTKSPLIFLNPTNGKFEEGSKGARSPPSIDHSDLGHSKQSKFNPKITRAPSGSNKNIILDRSMNSFGDIGIIGRNEEDKSSKGPSDKNSKWHERSLHSMAR